MLDLGDTQHFTFATADGDSGVVLTIGQPDGTTATPPVTADAPTLFSADFTATQPGMHRVRWSSAKAARTDVFNVRTAATDLQIISLADAKAHLNMKSDVDDEELRGWVSAATRVVERHVDEIIARRSFTQRFRSSGSRRLRLTDAPVVEVTALSRLDRPTTWDLADVTVEDAALGLVHVGGPRPHGDMQVTYTAGYRVIPEHYLGATAIIAAHLFETQRRGTMGQQVALNGDVTMQPSGAGWAIPNRAVELLGSRPPLVV